MKETGKKKGRTKEKKEDCFKWIKNTCIYKFVTPRSRSWVYHLLIISRSFCFNKYLYCISSDFSDLPDMTGEYIVSSICSIQYQYIFNLMYFYSDSFSPSLLSLAIAKNLIAERMAILKPKL